MTQSAYQVRVARSERGLRRRPGPGVGLRPRGVGRVHPARVRRTAALVGQTVLLAGSRLGRRRPRVGLERAGLVGDGPAGAGRLEGELDRARPRGGRYEAGPGAHAAARVHAERTGRTGARLRDEPRPLRAAPQRPARRRRALHARLDQLQQASAVPDLRRDAACSRPAPTRWARCSATAGIAATSALDRTGATSTASAWPCSARSGHLQGRPHARSSAPTRAGRRRRARS